MSLLVMVCTWLKPTLSACRISEPVTSNRLICATLPCPFAPGAAGVASAAALDAAAPVAATAPAVPFA
jgi:hypothetical protein